MGLKRRTYRGLHNESGRTGGDTDRIVSERICHPSLYDEKSESDVNQRTDSE